MKAILLHFCAFVEICAIVSLSAETPPPNTELYGPYPTHYKEIVMQWLNKQLINPESARIELLSWAREANMSMVIWLVSPQTPEIGLVFTRASKNTLCSSVMAK